MAAQRAGESLIFRTLIRLNPKETIDVGPWYHTLVGSCSYITEPGYEPCLTLGTSHAAQFENFEISRTIAQPRSQILGSGTGGSTKRRLSCVSRQLPSLLGKGTFRRSLHGGGQRQGYATPTRQTYRVAMSLSACNLDSGFD